MGFGSLIETGTSSVTPGGAEGVGKDDEAVELGGSSCACGGRIESG